MNNMEITIDFIKKLKQRILASRYVVAKIANAESLMLYYRIGSDIENEIKSAAWGDKTLNEISARLQQELPGLRGFSATNLKRMRFFYNAWKHSDLIGSTVSNQLENAKNEISPSLTGQIEKVKNEIGPTLSDQLEKSQNEFGPTLSDQIENPNLTAFLSVSFSHHFDILTKVENEIDRLYYIEQTARNFWSVRYLRTELNNQQQFSEKKSLAYRKMRLLIS